MIDSAFAKYLNPQFILLFILTEVFTLLVGSAVVCFYLVIIALSIPIYLYRFILSKVTRHLNPSLGKMVTARGQFLAIEKFTSTKRSPRSNIVASMAVKGHITVDQVRSKIKSNLLEMRDAEGNLKYPEATQYVTSHMGFKFWKPDPYFSLSNHVTLYRDQDQSQSETQPGTDDPPFTYSQLQNLLEVLVNQPFQPDRSPWELIVVSNYINLEQSPESMTLVLFKLHHCLTDGFGAMSTFMTALSTMPPTFPKPNYAERHNLRLILFKLTFPLRVLREVSHFIVMSFKDNPWKVKDHQKSWKLLYQNSPTIPIGTVKEIKNRFGVSFASVIHSCFGRAMERCLVSKYGQQKANGCGKMPCVVILPLPDHPMKLRNFCTGVMIHLPTSNMDPIARLRQCEYDLFIAKKSTMPLMGKILPIIGGSLFGGLAGLIGKNRSFPVSLSNFPLSETPFEICGKKVATGQISVGPAAGVAGLGIIVYSYVDGIQIGVSGEQGIFSREDLSLLIEGVMDEMQILYDNAVV